MPADPQLLLFLAGVLTGVAVSLLVARIPDAAFILRYTAARRRTKPRKRRLFLS
jgi:hypothetical protein